MKKWICSLASCALAYAMDFDEAWRIVQKNNHTLKAGNIAIEKSEKLKQANLMLYLPKIDLDAGYAYLGNPVSFDPKSALEELNSSFPILGQLPSISNFLTHLTPLELSNQHIITASVKIIYPLYTGGAVYAANNLGKLALEDAQEAFRLSKLSTFEQLANVYYGVLLNQEILQTLQDVEQGHKLHLQNAKKLQQAGQIAKIETLSAQVAYDRAKNDTLKAQDSLEVAWLALRTLLSESKSNLKLTSKLDINNKARKLILKPLLDRTLQAYPALSMVDIKAKQAQEVTKLERSKFLPKIAVFGNYSYHDSKSILGKSLPSWFVGVGAKMPLFDNTGSYQKYQASKIAQLEIAERKTQAMQDISLLVKKTHKEAIQARELYFTLNSSIELAEENLSLQEKAFAQGMATSTQVVDARNLLSKAKIEQKSVAYKYILSVAKLMALSDSLDDFKLY